MLRSASDGPVEDQKGGVRAAIVEFPQQPSSIAINGAVIAMFALIVFSSISFTAPIWTLNLTSIHVVMLFSIAFLLIVGNYLKINATKYHQIVPARRNIAVSAQSVTKSIEAIDGAFRSIDAQAALMKDMLTENMLSTGKTEVGAFNQRLQESTGQIKKLFETTKSLKENREILERQRQQLLNLRGQL
jgi:hypothetical protein